MITSLKKKNRGFTLIELMIVTGILSIIVVAIFAVLEMGRKSWYLGTDKIEVQQNARLAVDYMVKELRQAKIILTGTESIRFNLPAGASGGSTLWGTDEIEYLRDTGDLNSDGETNQILRRIIDSSDAPKVIANNITSVQFTQPTVEEVKITLTAQKQSFLDTITFTLTSRVTLRN